MILAWANENYVRVPQPSIDEAERHLSREGSLHDRGMRGETEKRQDHDPRKIYPCGP